MSSHDSKVSVDGKMETSHIEEVSTEDTNASDPAAVHNNEHDHKHTLWTNVKKYRKVVWITIGLTSKASLISFRRFNRTVIHQGVLTYRAISSG